ncbi:hypothetical protein GJ496_011760 [Pomphorhynchus laevis]|nr:hypothetical protein GJ496_011760 [Pomphorhynchus laevis]
MEINLNDGQHKRFKSQFDINAFKELTKRDAIISLKKVLNRLLETSPEDQKEHYRGNFEGFEILFTRFIQETGPSVQWSEIDPLPSNSVITYDDLKCPEEDSDSDIKNWLNKIVVIKLNGGLGTSMGCDGPKSLIIVRNELTFLDITIQQVEYLNNHYGCDIPLVLMNSFNTHEDTKRVLQKYMHVNVKIYTFNQSMYPRIEKETMLPLITNLNEDSSGAWYPPGHGDFYQSFYSSGLLKKFLDLGKVYAFVSNIDNLGATVDLQITKFLVSADTAKRPEFLMELTDKTRADVKGGTLVMYKNKLRLLEVAQVPKEHVDEFKSVQKFKVFNTNNMWIELKAIKNVIDNKALYAEIILNPKTLDNGLNVIQLETASGAAIKCFDTAQGINVPRSRFLPVKTTSDLLLIMSNLFVFEKAALIMNPRRSFPSVPLVKLGAEFKKVQNFLKRFENIPDCLELDSLTVAGNVSFGGHNILRGTVIIIANYGDRIDIPLGAILENKVISGRLTILDH